MPPIRFFYFLVLLIAQPALAQPDRWQQKVKYTMDVNVNVQTNRLTGIQRLEYTNNSPDTLQRVFYHLYWNAFAPGSMMDNRSRELGRILVRNNPDWDPRIADRIALLQPDEIGYQKVRSLKMNGVAQNFQEEETVLEVRLIKPILPKSTVVLEMEFEAQVPIQIRRSGRDNPQTGVRYSMSQWYPKICEYDYEGWHPTPYVEREFYGVWGDYDVKITIDKSYILGGTGYLQNANQIGYGYEVPGTPVNRPSSSTLTWHFQAPMVHDFVWAADPGYKHLVKYIPNGPAIHVLYKNKNNDPKEEEAWKTMAQAAVQVLPYIEKNFGKYPYRQYSFIQGGDGGMEYPMATLLKGPGLQGNAFHEWMHSWYQGMLGTNESEYAWMDEGFTSWADAVVSAYYNANFGPNAAASQKAVDPNVKAVQPDLPLNHARGYAGYFALVKSGLEEPLTTHADHFNTNFAYVNGSYAKGEVFLEQLGYITGAEVRDKILLEYYRQWRFKHPNAGDFMRVAEKVSGLKLDWYKEYWIHTTKTIDYSIDSLWEESGKTKIRLRMLGKMPMPVDVALTYRDGTKEIAYIPQYLMFGNKPAEDPTLPRLLLEPWKWTQTTYTFEIHHKLTELKIVEIDPSQRMADLNRKNNKLEIDWGQ
jgi:Peptidase family M1 domain